MRFHTVRFSRPRNAAAGYAVRSDLAAPPRLRCLVRDRQPAYFGHVLEGRKRRVDSRGFLLFCPLNDRSSPEKLLLVCLPHTKGQDPA